MIIRNEKDSITNGIIGVSNEIGVGKFYKLGSEFETQTAFAVGGTTNTFIENGKKYRCHTFKSPDNIVFPKAGKVEFLVVGGGGSGGTLGNWTDAPPGAFRFCSGGGAGGYRAVNGNCKYSLPVIVGNGGSNVQISGTYRSGSSGASSSFLSIVSAGGGRGGNYVNEVGQPGGSGGGGTYSGRAGGAGNIPAVSPPQGNPGGVGAPGPSRDGGGGGGAGGAGTPAAGGGGGGAGITSSFTGTSITRARGGNRGLLPSSPSDSGNGGKGFDQSGSPGEVSIRYIIR